MDVAGTPFNGFDIVVIGVVLVSALMAAARGLARELISIVALVVALVVSLFAWGRFRFAAQDMIDPPWLADGALALGAFAVAYMLVVALMGGVAKGLLGRDVGFLGRLLGGAFGAARGLVVMALFVMVPTASFIADRDRIREEERAIAGRTDIPADIRERLLAPQQSLPLWLESSRTYPILETVGDLIRTLPFADIRGAADDLREGELPTLPAQEG